MELWASRGQRARTCSDIWSPPRDRRADLPSQDADSTQASLLLSREGPRCTGAPRGKWNRLKFKLWSPAVWLWFGCWLREMIFPFEMSDVLMDKHITENAPPASTVIMLCIIVVSHHLVFSYKQELKLRAAVWRSLLTYVCSCGSVYMLISCIIIILLWKRLHEHLVQGLRVLTLGARTMM